MTNIFGIWCEIHQCGSTFEAHRLARAELLLLDAPLMGIDYSCLQQMGELLTCA